MFVLPQNKIKNVKYHPGDSNESDIRRLNLFWYKAKAK